MPSVPPLKCPCSLSDGHPVLPEPPSPVCPPFQKHWTAEACCYKWAPLRGRGWNAEATETEDIWQLKRNASWGREAAVPRPVPRESLDKVNEHSQQSHRHHKWQGKEERDSGHEGKTAANTCGWGEEEPLWPEESKQVTGLTPGTEGSIPGKQSNTAGKKGDWLSEQRSTWIQDKISKLYKEHSRWEERQNDFICGETFFRAMFHFKTGFVRIRATENYFTAL